ncbi:MAG: type I-U CRISPR-associated protein Cas5/Cas6 [Burkholderiales bacterium]|nr:type I-U CRISPR-associated protein Cas5/Cas6 [Burkholderiales bacterium]MDE1926902.1 type I-U CRISPR-associated protein Cas5/Cas6 [Burkholderiales bacterium]MDE2157521.1 type I-U CRISPR-associated protein Cas5/Cas6 [Burkholderiales bacterium]MDE2501727.1 type I-U CRISPR-associated protein Cas5/Cas6 [Burkholderiales bacterium]
MFAIAADYLMGWAMAASDGARKQRVEWPPHPDRLFMALAAAWFETGRDAAEGAALRWLETLAAPAMAVSAAEMRDPVIHFVPVNDPAQSSGKLVETLVGSATTDLGKLKDAGLAQLPQWRGRQPRAFPVAVPHDPVVHFIWTGDALDEHRHALGALCGKLTRIGHSASLVRAWVEDAPPAPTWVVGHGLNGLRLRISGSGRLDDLERRYAAESVRAHAAMEAALKQAKGQEKKRIEVELRQRFPTPPVQRRPESSLWESYVPSQVALAPSDIAHGVFDDRPVILALSGQRLGLASTLLVSQALRGALLAAATQPLPEWLSGHQPNGLPSRNPHLALIPLPFTGADRADGRLMGAALVLPRGVAAEEARTVLEPFLRDTDGLPREIRLFDGHALDCRVALETRESPPNTLMRSTWVGPSRRWATVSPIVLDRHVDGPDRWERAAEVVADACERIGLPRPVDVLLHPNSLHNGVPPAGAFAPLMRKRDGGRMSHTHAVLRFGTEVLGPVLVGAGRFRGYGLCRPLRHGGGSD